MGQNETETTIISYWQRHPVAYFAGAASFVFAISSLGLGLHDPPGDGVGWLPLAGFLLVVASQMGLLRYERVYSSPFETKIMLAWLGIGALGATAAYDGSQTYGAFSIAAALMIYVIWRKAIVGVDSPSREPGRLWITDRRGSLMNIAGIAALMGLLTMPSDLRASGLGGACLLVAAGLVLASSVRFHRGNGIKRPWQVTVKTFAVTMALMLAGVAAMLGLILAEMRGMELDPMFNQALIVAFIAIPAGLSVWYSIRAQARARDDLRP